MKPITAVLLATLALQPVFAKVPLKHDAYTQSDEADLVEHGTYANKDGRTVHSPAHTRSGKAPKGATAKCRDGSYSFSQHRRGTCSRHGGVANWLS
ncbi:DUF3761 domain-containing protein [Neisseriaceae bacterium JH1-16]|nr:DUF3761 domain-containing protein [Neisseriaceae bacterium JH1-16]